MRRFALGFGLLAIVLSSNAQNQYFNQQLLPLGDESALLANSGIAGQSPNSAVIFNPAALVLNTGNSFSFSGNAYFEFEYTAEGAASLGGESIDLNASGLQFMPTSLIYHLDKWGWNFSFALCVPNYLDYTGEERFESASGSPFNKLNITEGVKESLYSGFLGAGKDLGEGWSLGFSIYGNYYSYSNIIVIEQFSTGNPADFYLYNGYQEAESYSLGAMFGLLKQWESLRLGLTLTSPNLNLFAQGVDRGSTSIAGTNSIPKFTSYETNDVKTHLSNGARIGLGIDYRIGKRLEWSADFNYFGPQSQGLFPASQAGEASYRASTGFKYSINSNSVSYLGFAYLPSSKNGSQRETTVLTAGSRLRIGRTLNSVGVFFANSSEELLNGSAQFDYFGIMIGSTVDLDF